MFQVSTTSVVLSILFKVFLGLSIMGVWGAAADGVLGYSLPCATYKYFTNVAVSSPSLEVYSAPSVMVLPAPSERIAGTSPSSSYILVSSSLSGTGEMALATLFYAEILLAA